VLNIQHGDPVTEKEVARGLIKRQEYIDQPELVRIREGFSLLDLKRYVDQRGYDGIGYGKLEVENLTELAPILVPINTIGYNHFVIFRGIAGDRVLLADPAWGNRTMTVERFERSWIDYGTIGRVGFVVARTDGPVPAPAGDLAPRLEDFLTLN
jgi:predicted double-glycine peptidase